jgi:hypothetical protein
MNTLHSRIQAITADFCDALLVAIRGASIEELTGNAGPAQRSARAATHDDAPPASRPVKTGKGGRLARRSDEDIALVVQDILTCVAKHPEGIRAEELRSELGLAKNEIGKPIMAALASGALRKEGWKRATCYFVGKKGGGAKASTKPAVKKAAKKPTKKVVAAPKKKAATKARAKVKAAPKKKPAVKAKAAPKKAKAGGKKAADQTVNGAAAPSTPAASAEATA